MDCMVEVLWLLLLNKWRTARGGGGLLGLLSDYLHLSHKEEITIIAVLLILTLLGTAAKLWIETSKHLMKDLCCQHILILMNDFLKCR